MDGMRRDVRAEAARGLWKAGRRGGGLGPFPGSPPERGSEERHTARRLAAKVSPELFERGLLRRFSEEEGRVDLAESLILAQDERLRHA
jgi:hypothetical protein